MKEEQMHKPGKSRLSVSSYGNTVSSCHFENRDNAGQDNEMGTELSQQSRAQQCSRTCCHSTSPHERAQGKGANQPLHLTAVCSGSPHPAWLTLSCSQSQLRQRAEKSNGHCCCCSNLTAPSHQLERPECATQWETDNSRYQNETDGLFFLQDWSKKEN